MTPRSAPTNMRRDVLVVVPDVAAGARLLDVSALLAADHRISTVFTAVPVAGGGDRLDVERFLHAQACRVLPWQRAVSAEFDLLLADDSRGLARLTGKPLLLSNSELDLCYDQLLASIPYRAQYRRAFGLSRGQKLVVVVLTAPCGDVRDDQADVLDRLLVALPPERYRVAAVVPSDVWSAYGGWRVHAWLARFLLRGLLLLPPDDGWRAALVGGNLIVGDDCAVTRYGAAIGLPVMLTGPGDGPADATAELLDRNARRWHPDRPVSEQVDLAMRSDRSWQDDVARRLTSSAGRAGDILRRAMYELLDLPEPSRAVPCYPVPLPRWGHDGTALFTSLGDFSKLELHL